MCGRYYFDDETMADIRHLADVIDETLKNKSINGDIYPSNSAPVIAAGQQLTSYKKEKIPYTHENAVFNQGENQKISAVRLKLAAGLMAWGFPNESLSGDRAFPQKTSRLLINARAETVFSKVTFKESIKQRRCVIPAGHYYEWDKSKNKVSFYNAGHQSMYMAGFYRKYGSQWHFIIVTTKANQSVEGIHDRMPLILNIEEIIPWIYDTKKAECLLKKTPAPLCPVIPYEQQRILF